jgi:hypothetical protein
MINKSGFNTPFKISSFIYTGMKYTFVSKYITDLNEVVKAQKRTLAGLTQ